MGRRPKAWFWGGDGVRPQNGKRLPGAYTRYNIYNDTGVHVKSPSRHFRTVALARQWVRDHNTKLDLGQADQMVLSHSAKFSTSCSSARPFSLTAPSQDYQFAVVKLISYVVDIDVWDIRGIRNDRVIAARYAEGRKPATVALDIRGFAEFSGSLSSMGPTWPCCSVHGGRASRPIVEFREKERYGRTVYPVADRSALIPALRLGISPVMFSSVFCGPTSFGRFNMLAASMAACLYCDCQTNGAPNDMCQRHGCKRRFSLNEDNAPGHAFIDGLEREGRESDRCGGRESPIL